MDAKGGGGAQQGLDEGPDNQMEDLKIFVGGISWHSTYESLHKYFTQFGPVSEVIVKIHEGGKARGFAFVTFESKAGLDAVFAPGVSHVIDDRPVEVKIAMTQEKQRAAKLRTNRLWVAVRPDVETKVIREYFQQFGEVEDVVVKMDSTTGRRRGFVFIICKSEDSVEEAMKLTSHAIQGRQIIVKRAEDEERGGANMRAMSYPGMSQAPVRGRGRGGPRGSAAPRGFGRGANNRGGPQLLGYGGGNSYGNRGRGRGGGERGGRGRGGRGNGSYGRGRGGGNYGNVANSYGQGSYGNDANGYNTNEYGGSNYGNNDNKYGGSNYGTNDNKYGGSNYGTNDNKYGGSNYGNNATGYQDSYGNNAGTGYDVGYGTTTTTTSGYSQSSSNYGAGANGYGESYGSTAGGGYDQGYGNQDSQAGPMRASSGGGGGASYHPYGQ